MAASRVLTPGVRRVGTLLVMAAIATALSGVAPAAAGGKPMPLAPSQRSTAAASHQVAEVLRANPGSRRISATSVLLAPGVVMTVPGPVTAAATMTVPLQGGKQVTVAATDTSCAYQWLCMWEHVWRGGAKLAFYSCGSKQLANYYIRAGDSWRDDISSIWNNQSGGVVSAFYDWKLIAYRLVGTLSAGNYLMDLTRDRAADGGTWNDRIDQVYVC